MNFCGFLFTRGEEASLEEKQVVNNDVVIESLNWYRCRVILILLLIARQGYTYVDIGLEQAGPEKEEQEEIGELENLMRANFLVVADELEQDSEEVLQE